MDDLIPSLLDGDSDSTYSRHYLVTLSLSTNLRVLEKAVVIAAFLKLRFVSSGTKKVNTCVVF